MKKINKLFSVFIATILLSFCLSISGCFMTQEGDYYFKSLTVMENGTLITIVEGENFMNTGITLTEDTFKVTLDSDNKAIINGMGISGIGSWSRVNNEQIIIDGITCFCDGRTLKMEIDGMELVLEKKLFK